MSLIKITPYLLNETLDYVFNNVTATGNLITVNANLGNAATANYFVGNGSFLTGLPAGYANSNVAAYLPTYTGEFTVANITSSANITASYFIGNGSSLTHITGGNVDGQVSNALIASTVYSNAQPNITSVGALVSLSVTGTVNAGNVTSSGAISGVDLSVSGNAIVTGNLTVHGNTIYTNVETLYVQDPIIEMGGGANGDPLTTNDGKDRGSLLHYYTTAPVDAFMGWDNSAGQFAFGSNVTLTNEVATFNSYGNVRADRFIGNGSLLTSITGGNVDGQVANALVAGTVYTNAQPNITSVGTLVDLTVTGNVTAGNFITSGSSGNISGANYVVANYFQGNGSQLTGLNASNLASGTISSGILGNSTVYVGTTSIALNRSSGSQTLTGIDIDGSANYATYAGTVTTNAQPNITSLGTLTSLSVTSNVSAGNVLTDHLLYANGVEWNFGSTYSNANVAAYLPTYTGELSVANINASGNITASYLIGNGSQLTGLPASYANSNVAAYLPTYTGLISGTLSTQAQPNVTSLGTLTDLDVSGNVTVDGTLYANAIVGPTSANVTITAGAFVSTFDEFGNIELSDNVSVVGNLTAANVKTDHLLYANGDPYIFTTSAAGSNTQIQFNDDNDFAGDANLTFDRATNTVTTDNIVLNNDLTVNGLTDLGSVSDITITGGGAGYVLTTDGLGGLSWGTAGAGGLTSLVSIAKDRYLADGSTSSFSLSTTPASKNLIEVVIDGLQQISNTYTLTGDVLSFPSNPAAGQVIEVTEFGAVDLTGNVGEVQFNNGSAFGSSNTFTFNTGTNTLSVTHLTATGNLTSQAGYVYVDNGIIAVASGNAGIFNTGIGNINLGLAANVTMGSTSGNITARGTFNSNVAVVNTIGVSNYYSTRDAVTVTTDTIIDQFSVNTYRSAKYTMRVNSDDGYQAVEVLLVHDGSSSYVTIYGSISSSGSDIVSLSSNVGSGNVRLFASTASTNTNVKVLGTYVPD